MHQTLTAPAILDVRCQKMKTRFTVLALLAAVGCRPDPDSAGIIVDGDSDTARVARQAGHDYGNVVEGCLAKRADSMHTFFWLSQHAGFDAASHQGHAAVSGDLLRRLGDRFFGECLAREEPPVQNRVREDLLYDLGYGNTDMTLADIKRQYPRTFPAWFNRG